MVTRRTLLKGLAAGAAAILLPPSLSDNADTAKRFWALDSTMLDRSKGLGARATYTAIDEAAFFDWIASDDASYIDDIHLSDPSIGMPVGQTGGRPPSPPYETIELDGYFGAKRGDVIRIVDFVDGKAVIADPPEERFVIKSIRWRDGALEFS